MKKIFNITLIALVAIIGFSSCSDDEHEASVLSGEWEGDWNMWYEDDRGRIWYAAYTCVRFDRSTGTSGTGIQVDYYDRGPYRCLNYRFRWEVRNGVIYLTYPGNHELDVDIYDYRLSNRYFDGYFGSSNAFFTMDKITSFDYWTPTIWVDSYWGYTAYYYGSNNFEGVAGAKPYSADSLPKIVKRGGHQPGATKP